MKQAFLVLVVFAVVALALINLKPVQVVKEIKEVVREVPVIQEHVVFKEVPKVVVKEIVKERPVVYRTVNHYYTEHKHDVVYYRLPDEPRVQPVSYKYYESVETEKEVRPIRHAVESARKPKVRMFLVDGIREPIYAKEDYDD